MTIALQRPRAALIGAVAALLLVALVIGLATSRMSGSSSRTAESVKVVNAGTVSVPPVQVSQRTADSPLREEETASEPFTRRYNLRPHYTRGTLDGYSVEPADPRILAGSPLRAGDVITVIDGIKLDESKFRRLDEDMSGLADVFVSYSRDGKVSEDVLPLGR